MLLFIESRTPADSRTTAPPWFKSIDTRLIVNDSIDRVFEDSDQRHLILEFGGYQTLYDRRMTYDTFSEQEATVMEKLVSAMAHCHRIGAAHRDVKPDNVFVDDRSDRFLRSDVEQSRTSRLDKLLCHQIRSLEKLCLTEALHPFPWPVPPVHIVPKQFLSFADLEKLPVGTVLPTLEQDLKMFVKPDRVRYSPARAPPIHGANFISATHYVASSLSFVKPDRVRYSPARAPMGLEYAYKPAHGSPYAPPVSYWNRSADTKAAVSVTRYARLNDVTKADNGRGLVDEKAGYLKDGDGYIGEAGSVTGTEMRKTTDLVKEYNARFEDKAIAIVLDTKGPEVRSGDVSQPNMFQEGREFNFTIRRGISTGDTVSVNYDDFMNDGEAGDILLVNDGMMSLAVKSKSNDTARYHMLEDFLVLLVEDRTITVSFDPRWNEQYTWQVYDPCTVLTLAVFDNWRMFTEEISSMVLIKIREIAEAYLGTSVKRFCGNEVMDISLMSMYGKFGCLNAACKVFDKMAERDVASWNGVVSWYGRAGCVGMARELFDESGVEMILRNSGYNICSVADAVSEHEPKACDLVGDESAVEICGENIEQELAAARGREKALQEQLIKEVNGSQERYKKHIESHQELEATLRKETKLSETAESAATLSEQKAGSWEENLNLHSKRTEKEIRQLREEILQLKKDSKLSISRLEADLERMECRSENAEEESILLKLRLEQLEKQHLECIRQKTVADFKPKDLTKFQFSTNPEFNLEVEVVSDGESIDTNRDEERQDKTEQDKNSEQAKPARSARQRIKPLDHTIYNHNQLRHAASMLLTAIPTAKAPKHHYK